MSTTAYIISIKRTHYQNFIEISFKRYVICTRVGLTGDWSRTVVAFVTDLSSLNFMHTFITHARFFKKDVSKFIQ